ncbi:serine--tRNA ligase [Candidatus Kaiserbacteria bacterium RIFCSPHIGHO2_01_FULL_54_36b]|uniref:Serine--tRNA ligase n=1 Tax=Candidatus Kaiserbacteria bacterium RIFCSPHIGHO2_01_FULL_54_36b TaxID=1798483 RepID=A0A1F6CRX0_9BACT|nr:MAG: serine--tRNA ligase [Candidatus Kaiserbacteria bacterium RIFCSPHIGHO2_01_FULL_54_36b]
MLDIAFIKENRAVVEAAIQNKKRGPIDLVALIKLADERKELRGKIDEINRKRNEAASARDIEKGRRLKEELAQVEAAYETVEKQLVPLLLSIPNIPSPDTPVADDEKGNKVLRQVGEKRRFGNYSPKPHWEVGEALGLIDSETASEVSGARFAYIKGGLAMMQFALLQFALKVLTDEEVLKEIAARAGLKVSTKPFVPVIPPYMMKSAVMNRMARLNPIDERYYFEKDDMVFIGSAEHTLGPMHMDEIIAEEKLPIRYVGYSPAFRREAGSYGKDTRGILRLHHFDKVEMETFTRPEDGYLEQDFLVAIQEHLIQLLDLPYQALVVSTGDMGFPDQRQIDLEIWMPGQGVYRETHSADYMGGFQARRLNTRLKRADGSIEPVHMNDATALAMGRTLVGILENYQESDGSLKVPKVLQQFVGKDIIKKGV